MKRLSILFLFLLFVSGVQGQVSTNTAFRFRKLPTFTICKAGDVTFDTGSNVFKGCTATNTPVTFNTGAAVTPGGSNTQIQFNDLTAFGGNADFTFTKSNGTTTTSAFSLHGSALPSESTTHGVAASNTFDLLGSAGQATSFSNNTSRGGKGAIINIVAGPGGANSDTNTNSSSNHRGGLGGDLNLFSGDGGAGTNGTGVVRGGTGGAALLKAGTGGAAAHAAAGLGGNASIYSGDGGTSATTTAGNAGITDVSGGLGGISSGAAASGDGGLVDITGGSGGNNATAGGTAGNGGNVRLNAGSAGAASGGAATGSPGSILIGDSVAGPITIGTVGSTTTFGGTVVIPAVAITDDTTTNASMLPVWVTTNTGNLPLKVTSTKLTFNPSTGSLNATGSVVTPTLSGTSQITGTTGNMTITAGTGNSRTMALQTTTSGGTATTFLTGNADQSVTFGGTFLAIGGTSSSFPALKRSGTGLIVRLADDSANAPITASAGTFSSTVDVSGNLTANAALISGSTLEMRYNSSTGHSGGGMDASGTAFRTSVNKGDVGTIQIASTGLFSFGSTTGNQRTENPDTTISRNAAGVVQIGTTAANALGSLLATGATFSGALINTGITSDATHTDSAVCQDTTTHQFYAGSGAAGICLGTSSKRFKNSIGNLNDGLGQLMKLRPRSFFYNKGYGDNGDHLQYGFIAEEMAHPLPNLVRPDINGTPQSIDYMGLMPVVVNAIQQQQGEIDVLKRLEARVIALEKQNQYLRRQLRKAHK